MMFKISFVEDPISRRATRFLLLLEIGALVLVVFLSLVDLFFFAFALSSLTFVLFIAIFLWLYSRYQDLSIVREKRELKRLVLKFQKSIQTEEHLIQAAIKERGRLFQAEKDETSVALSTLQKTHIEDGLAAASVKDGVIPGVGTKLKERLATQGIISAVQVTEKI